MGNDTTGVGMATHVASRTSGNRRHSPTPRTSPGNTDEGRGVWGLQETRLGVTRNPALRSASL